MNTSRLVMAMLSLSSSLIMAGCKSLEGSETEPEIGTFQYIQVPHVVLQLCLPKRTVSFQTIEVDLTRAPKEKTLLQVRSNGMSNHSEQEISYAAKVAGNIIEDTRDKDFARRLLFNVRASDFMRKALPFGQILLRQGQFSDSAEHIYLVGDTESNQPVFEQQIHRHQHIVAIHFAVEEAIDGKSQWVTYWFKPPQHISSELFSEWQNPVSEEGKNEEQNLGNKNWFRLTHGQEMHLYKVKDDGPKVRYKTMTINDYYDARRFSQRTMAAFWGNYRKQNGKLTQEEEDQVVIFPKPGAPIPKC